MTKKRYTIENLDCANCAAKMEKAISKIDGVKHVTVSFFAQKLVLEAEDEKWDDVVRAMCRAVSDVDPDCTVNVK